MAYQKGTATGYIDLLEKLHAFATANGWVSQRNETISNEKEIAISSTGITNDDFILLSFRTQTLAASDAFNIKCRASSVWVPGTFDNLTGASPINVLYAWDAEIEYYFIVNADRIMIAFLVSGVVQYYYGGNMQTYTSRGHWPSPICCFAVGTDVNARWSSTGDNFSGWQFIRGSNPCMIQDFDNTWTKPNYMWPSMDSALIGTLRPYDSGDVPLLQLMVKINKYGVVGELPGAFAIGGFSLANWQELTHSSGRKFLVVQNVYRTTTTDYLAMELS